MRRRAKLYPIKRWDRAKPMRFGFFVWVDGNGGRGEDKRAYSSVG